MKDALEGADKKVEAAILMLVEERDHLKRRIGLIERRIEGFQAILADAPLTVEEPRRQRLSARKPQQNRLREPLVGAEGSEFAGLPIKEAVAKLLSDQPQLRPAQIRDILQAGGFPFRARSPLNSVSKAMQDIRKNGTGAPA